MSGAWATAMLRPFRQGEARFNGRMGGDAGIPPQPDITNHLGSGAGGVDAVNASAGRGGPRAGGRPQVCPARSRQPPSTSAAAATAGKGSWLTSPSKKAGGLDKLGRGRQSQGRHEKGEMKGVHGVGGGGDDGRARVLLVFLVYCCECRAALKKREPIFEGMDTEWIWVRVWG